MSHQQIVQNSIKSPVSSFNSEKGSRGMKLNCRDSCKYYGSSVSNPLLPLVLSRQGRQRSSVRGYANMGTKYVSVPNAVVWPQGYLAREEYNQVEQILQLGQ